MHVECFRILIKRINFPKGDYYTVLLSVIRMFFLLIIMLVMKLLYSK